MKEYRAIVNLQTLSLFVYDDFDLKLGVTLFPQAPRWPNGDLVVDSENSERHDEIFRIAPQLANRILRSAGFDAPESDYWEPIHAHIEIEKVGELCGISMTANVNKAFLN